MKSAMLFAGIGLSALLLAACDSKPQNQVEQKAEQAMEQKGDNMGADKQPATKTDEGMKKPDSESMMKEKNQNTGDKNTDSSSY